MKRETKLKIDAFQKLKKGYDPHGLLINGAKIVSKVGLKLHRAGLSDNEIIDVCNIARSYWNLELLDYKKINWVELDSKNE